MRISQDPSDFVGQFEPGNSSWQSNPVEFGHLLRRWRNQGIPDHVAQGYQGETRALQMVVDEARKRFLIYQQEYGFFVDSVSLPSLHGLDPRIFHFLADIVSRRKLSWCQVSRWVRFFAPSVRIEEADLNRLKDIDPGRIGRRGKRVGGPYYELMKGGRNVGHAYAVPLFLCGALSFYARSVQAFPERYIIPRDESNEEGSLAGPTHTPSPSFPMASMIASLSMPLMVGGMIARSIL